MYDYNLFLSCDWGTSSFRLRLVETETAAILYEIKASEGIRNTFQKYQSLENPDKSKACYYQEFLLKQIQTMETKAGAFLKHIPLVFSGDGFV